MWPKASCHRAFYKVPPDLSPRVVSLCRETETRQIGAHDDVAGEPARLGSLPEITCVSAPPGTLQAP